jgi:hypothetical protein
VFLNSHSHDTHTFVGAETQPSTPPSASPSALSADVASPGGSNSNSTDDVLTNPFAPSNADSDGSSSNPFDESTAADAAAAAARSREDRGASVGSVGSDDTSEAQEPDWNQVRLVRFPFRFILLLLVSVATQHSQIKQLFVVFCAYTILPKLT